MQFCGLNNKSLALFRQVVHHFGVLVILPEVRVAFGGVNILGPIAVVRDRIEDGRLSALHHDRLSMVALVVLGVWGRL